GTFVSGSGAGRGSAQGPDRDGDAVGGISLAALRHGAALGLPETLLTSCLYAFGRRPFTPRLASLLPDEAAVAEFLCVTAVARAHWVESGTGPGDPWRMWRRRRPLARQGR